MPHSLQIIQSKDFVRLDAEGRYNVDETRRLFSDAIWACVHSRIGCILIDVRDAYSEMTATQIGALANVCREIAVDKREHRIAILTEPQFQFDRACILVDAVDGLGWNIAAFHNFEEAFNWLIS